MRSIRPGILLGLALVGALIGCEADVRPAAADAGLKIYRDGILPDGEPLTAIVAGDVPILGTQFSCGSCHGRSGMGSAEGQYIVPAVAGQFLFEPAPQPQRPAYTIESLATVLRDGVAPTGRLLDQSLMPRYRLDDAAIGALAAYLESLSAGNSPGVDGEVIRFATVMTDDVDPGDRKAVLAVLRQFFEDKNRETRLESERWDREYTPESRLPTVFREWRLEEWPLTGPRSGWGARLDELYEHTPVFAMVGGLATGGWGPVSEFCERHSVPCLFPGTSVPEAGDDDYYTVYFSRGLGLEADLIAAHLAGHPVSQLVQVYCDSPGAWAAGRLRSALGLTADDATDLKFSCDSPMPTAELGALLVVPDAVAVIWAGRQAFPELAGPLPAGRLYLSSTMLGEDAGAALPQATGSAFLVHAFRLPGRVDPAMRRFVAWARTRKLEVSSPRRQAEAFFACLVLKDAVKHMRRFFVRDYVMDMLEHSQGMLSYLAYYPRPTIGPGQRFVTKGGYVLPIVDGGTDTAEATWIVP